MSFALQDRNSKEMKAFIDKIRELPSADIVLWVGKSGTRCVIDRVYYEDEEINVDLIKEEGH
jgi:hypothetical protein